MDSKIDSTRTIAAPLPGRLSAVAAAIKARQKLLALGAIVLIGGALAYVWWSRRSSSDEFTTDKISRGNIEVVVSATGTVQAVTTVQVGSQVSGTVSWLGADFKSHVKQGQVVAKLDPALFQAQVNTASANLLNAQAGVQAAMTDIQNQTANVEASRANDRANAAQRDDAIAVAKQNEKLKGIIPDRDIEAAENAAKAAIARYSQASSQIGQAQAQLEIAKAKLKQAQAAVEQAKAQLQQANVNLEHTIISSPIDGVVVSRSVDVGQTVAASLQAPTLFTIANDLTNMQVLASIDEADVGQVRENGKARFTVDAFPAQTFNGDITQVRLNAQTVQNVVTYQAVINVANPDQKLMPGMTANITIPVAQRDDVLRVPNAALRFKPDLTDQQQKDLQAKIEAFRQQQSQRSTDNTQASDQNQGDQTAKQDRNKSGASAQTDTGKTGQQGPDRRRHAEGIAAASGDGSKPAAGGDWKQRRREGAGGSDQASGSAPGPSGAPSEKRQEAKDQTTNGPEKRKGQKPATAAPGPQSNADQTATTSGRSGGGGGGSRARQIQVIWVLTANKTLEPHVVRTGITDGRFTEIVASDIDFKDGDVIVTGQSDTSANNNRPQQTGAPFGQRPPGAGGGRGR